MSDDRELRNLREAFPGIWVREDGAFLLERPFVMRWSPGDVESDLTHDPAQIPGEGVDGRLFIRGVRAIEPDDHPVRLKLSQIQALADYITEIDSSMHAKRIREKRGAAPHQPGGSGLGPFTDQPCTDEAAVLPSSAARASEHESDGEFERRVSTLTPGAKYIPSPYFTKLTPDDLTPMERDYLLSFCGHLPPFPWGAAMSAIMEQLSGYRLIVGESDATPTGAGRSLAERILAQQGTPHTPSPEGEEGKGKQSFPLVWTMYDCDNVPPERESYKLEYRHNPENGNYEYRYRPSGPYYSGSGEIVSESPSTDSGTSADEKADLLRCGCFRCLEASGTRGPAPLNTPIQFTRMVVCEFCGNKRCPHATDHRLECTNSNDPGQPGSRYEAFRPATEDEGTGSAEGDAQGEGNAQRIEQTNYSEKHEEPDPEVKRDWMRVGEEEPV